MKAVNKDEFLKKSAESLYRIHEMLEELPEIEFESLEKENTALIIIDMINGFTKEGALKSSRVEAIIPEIVKLSKKSDEFNIPKIAFADSHTDESPEFDSYPVHCMKGSFEEELVDEIKEVGGYQLIPKNSTNGFLEEEFQEWFLKNQHINNFIITGGCTDICIQQFAITLKTWFNMHNKKSRVMVPINAVDTYDLDIHDGDLVHTMALYNMIINGVEPVKEIN